MSKEEKEKANEKELMRKRAELLRELKQLEEYKYMEEKVRMKENQLRRSKEAFEELRTTLQIPSQEEYGKWLDQAYEKNKKLEQKIAQMTKAMSVLNEAD